MSQLPLVLLSGASGSGKSSVAASVDMVAVLPADDYYLDVTDARLPRRFGAPDWNAPASLDWTRLHDDLDRLRRHLSIQAPVYDMRTSRRVAARSIDAGNARAVLVEGIFSFELASLAPIAKVFLACPHWLLAWRRFRRDLVEGRRGSLGAAAYSLALSLEDRRLTSRLRGMADVVIDARAPLATIAARLSRLIGVALAQPG